MEIIFDFFFVIFSFFLLRSRYIRTRKTYTLSYKIRIHHAAPPRIRAIKYNAATSMRTGRVGLFFAYTVLHPFNARYFYNVTIRLNRVCTHLKASEKFFTINGRYYTPRSKKTYCRRQLLRATFPRISRSVCLTDFNRSSSRKWFCRLCRRKRVIFNVPLDYC